MRRRIVATGVVVLLVGAGVATAVAAGSSDPPAADSGTDESAKQSTADVVRTDLVDTEDLDGTLGYGEPVELSGGRQGTITGLPAAGAVVERGGSVAEVNGLPVPLFIGSRPLWRTLTDNPLGADGLPTGEELTGPDVRIVEENLQALGFIDADSDAKVDDKYTGSTAEAVKRWQKSIGAPQTGVVEPTDAIVRESPIRISSQAASIGSQNGGPLVKVTGTERRITVSLAVAKRDLVAAGDVVTVTLPDSTEIPAHVESVGSIVIPGDQQQGTSDSIEVVVRPDDPTVLGTFESAPVTIAVVRSQATDVLAVPVGALTALAEGGYAVELVGGTGGSELVAVKVGAFADGLVQVEGDIAEGDRVVVPE